MGPFIAIAVVAVIVIAVLAGVYASKQTNKLYDSGAAYRNRAGDFYAQMHTFRTVVPDLETLLNSLDGRTLAQQGITVSRDAAANRLVFQDARNSFTATLTALPEDPSLGEGIFFYRFVVNRVKVKGGSVMIPARAGINVALTAVEKAFLTLDFNAVAQRVYITDWKTKTSFF